MAVDEQATRSRTPPREPDIPATPQTRTRRNPRWIALGIIAICLGAIASFFLYSQVAESHRVVAVRHSISRGETIKADDLGQVSVGDTGGLVTVPATRIGSLVGKVAAVDLVEGSLLPPDAITDVLPPDKGNGVIGIKVATGRAPSGFLAAGSPVRLVILPVDAAGVDATSGQSTSASTSGTAPPGDGSAAEITNVATISAAVINSDQAEDGVFLNLELATDEAVEAASYAAQGRVVVVRESER
ncbi:SAF domain-containing protein [Microlunatus soli]|uniref:SAF domain-containing protein n=1 Tax=Microlunatus soli TaxID=630515 RepID=A0A1H1UN56_9ACTN|nr:SAF domain-containing protein [Microlunatus soli]SDS73958.1 SAF domain-containing protein [Microlunatus soli]